MDAQQYDRVRRPESHARRSTGVHGASPELGERPDKHVMGQNELEGGFRDGEGAREVHVRPKTG